MIKRSDISQLSAIQLCPLYSRCRQY